MSDRFSDDELVRSYARSRSEPAFAALVNRYVDLVFATALRQTGDRSMAEEITQNVFLALARKAPRLAGRQTLGGWLHRTTLLEAKARLRTEFRRTRREQAAAALAELQHAHEETNESLLPLLDEALLSLNGTERELVLSRFVEGRTLRDAGALFGIGEEAARKRVSRSLQKLTQFFRNSGFAVPGTSAAVLAAAAQKAPATLAASAVESGLAVAAPSSLNLLWLNLMNASKTSVAVACVLVGAGSLLWQEQAVAKAKKELTAALTRQREGEREVAAVQDRIAQAQNEQRMLETEATRARKALEALQGAPRPTRAVAEPYRWSDESRLARVPKSMVGSMHVQAVRDRQGELEPRLREVLQMNPEETEQVQSALHSFLAEVRTAQQKVMQQVEPGERELKERKAGEVRVFAIGDIGETLTPARRELMQRLGAILGSERFEVLRDGLRYFMPLEGDSMVAGSMALFEGAHRFYFVKPAAAENEIEFGMTKPGSGMSARMTLEEVPDMFRPYLEDWLEMARRENAQN